MAEKEPGTQAEPYRADIVGAAFALAAFAWGVGFYGPAILLQALHNAYGLNISTLSLAISAHFLLSAALVTVLPEAHRRWGLGNVTLAGVGLAALGIVAWASAREPWHLVLAVPLSGMGWAATSGAAINAIVSPWFEKERPKALSMAFNGASFGGVVFPLVWTALADIFGLSGAAGILAAVMVAVLGPMIVGLVRPPPNREAAARRPDQLGRQAGLSRAQLLQDRRFITLSMAFALGLFAQVGLFAHLMARLAPVLGETRAAAVLSLTAASAIVGRTALAYALGSLDRRWVGFCNFLMQASGVLLIATGAHPVPVVAGCLLFGLGVGNLISLPPLIAQQEFAAEDVARVVALITAVNQAVFAFAPALLGFLREAAGDYSIAFALAALLQIAAAGSVILGRGRD